MQRQADAPPASDDGELEHWHFDLLRVPHDASDVEIKKAFKREMLRAHPDKNGSENANGSENTARPHPAGRILPSRSPTATCHASPLVCARPNASMTLVFIVARHGRRKGGG